MDSGSPSRKHPRSDTFASAAASLAPPNKRRRTTVLCNPVPQNLLSGVSPYAKYNRNAGSQTPAGTSSAYGLISAKQSDTHSITSSTGRSRLAEQVRSFAPKPLMSHFAARAALKNKSSSASALRYTISGAGPSGRASNGSCSRPSSRAGSVVSAMSPPAPRPMSVIGGGLFTPAKPVATPSRRIHHPDFSFDNKPPPSSFRFTANDSRANTPTAQSPEISSRAHTPVRREPTRGSPSVSFSSRASPAARRVSPTENKARADKILGFFSSSLDKARQALAGNRADRLEEKRQKEKEAIRKQMEEDERIRRAEIFEREQEREEMEMQEEMERIEERERMREREEIEERQEKEERAAEAQFISSVKHRSQEVQLSFDGANGGPSFVTEDTIPDTIYTDHNTQGSYYGVTSTFRDGHPAHDSSQEPFPRPSWPIGVTIDDGSDKMPQSPQFQRGPALHMERGNNRQEDSPWEPEVKTPQQPQDNIISLDSDDDDDDSDRNSEQETLRKPSFLFSRVATREDALADDVSSQDGGEYYENEEYEEEDDSRDYEEGEGEFEEFEEDVEAEEEYEEGREVSTTPRTYAIEDDGIEEVVDEFDSEPAEDSERLSEAEMDQYDAKAEGEYEEEETEKDDTDTERIVEWEIPKAGKDEDPDRSLGSTVLLPSQPTSFTNKRPSVEKETCGGEQLKGDTKVLVEEEEQVGLELDIQQERMAGGPRETEFSPAKENVDPFPKFHHNQGFARTPTPTHFLGSTDIPKNLALATDNTLFAKSPAGDECIAGGNTIKNEPEIPVDPDLEMQQAPTPTSDDPNPSPMAVDEEPKEGEEPLDAVKGAQLNGEVKGSEAAEELDELPEASDLVIIEDGEDEESRDDRSTLYPMLPDSVYDRSSIAREFTREATVETVEWDGGADALSEDVRIALERVEGSSESGEEPLQSEEPAESNEEVEPAEDLEVEVEEKEVEEVVIEAELDSEESDSGREDQSVEESAEEGGPGPVEEEAGGVEQTEEANLNEGAKSAALGIDLAGWVETEGCQAEELEAGVQADVEDAIDSEVDLPDNISEEPVALVGLGHQYNDDANSTQGSEGKQQNQTSGIEVVVEIDHTRQITPVSENTATPPPQSGVTPAERRRSDEKLGHRPPGSPLSDDSPVQQGLASVGDGIQTEDVDEAPAPAKKKRIRKHRPKKKRRKSGIDPIYVPSPQELEQDAEEETNSDMDQPAVKRRKSKPKSATTTPAKHFKLGEQLESDPEAVETVSAMEVASAREKREGKPKLGDGSAAPMPTSKEADIPPGIELRDGKVVQPPPIITSPKRTRRGQSAEPEVLSRENSEEPVRTLRNRNVVVNRCRSVSVEPSAGESDTGRAPKRTKRGHSTQPAAPSRDNSEEPGVRELRNRTVIVNRGRSASVEPSASETDTAGGVSRRKTRSSKTAVPEAPSTPKKKGKKAMELPLSSIKEVVAEDSPRKNARAARKK